MKSKNILIALAILAFVVFAAGCSKAEEKAPVEQTEDQIVDTGVLVVTSSPSAAHVFADRELKGDTPFTLYNFPVGPHSLVVKKEGYADFEKSIVIKVGRTEEIEAILTALTPIKSAAEENKPMAEKVAENPALSSPKLNKVNVSSSFILYYDFKNAMFTQTASASPDAFSSNYNTYLYFTAYVPSKMRVLNKQIKDVKKEDCINADDTIANLYSGQTLCVKTTEGLIAAIGGSWKTAPSELEWIVFS